MAFANPFFIIRMEKSMNELSLKITDLIQTIDRFMEVILIGSAELKDEYMKKFSGQMTEIFPQIVRCYMKPEFADVKEDMQYWTSQLARILEVLEQDDLFLTMDVLYHETRENLVLFQKMIDSLPDAAG